MTEPSGALVGAWVAFYYDGSEFAVFATELDARRYAAEKYMEIKLLPFGVGLNESFRQEMAAHG